MTPRSFRSLRPIRPVRPIHLNYSGVLSTVPAMFAGDMIGTVQSPKLTTGVGTPILVAIKLAIFSTVFPTAFSSIKPAIFLSPISNVVTAAVY